MYTLISHSKLADTVMLTSITSTQAIKVRSAGGCIFPTYKAADDAETMVNNLGAIGLYSRVHQNGRLARFAIGQGKVFIPDSQMKQSLSHLTERGMQ